MIFIKFNDKTKPYKGKVKRISEHVVEVSGEYTEAGFHCFIDESCKTELGDYDRFTTVYRADHNQLSDDGSHYVPPVPPTPTEYTLKMKGKDYKVIDFVSMGDIQFLMEGITPEEAIATFGKVSSVEVNGITYSNLVFSGAFEVERYGKTYTEVYIHGKTETEMLRSDVDANTEAIYGAEDAICEVAEGQAVKNNELEDAICEIYEMLGE